MEQLAHQRAGIDILVNKLLIVEQLFHQALWVSPLQRIVCLCLTVLFAQLLYQPVPRLIEVVLQRLAHIVMNLSCGVSGGQLLALSNHRQYTTVHSGATSINLQILGLEYLREVLSHTLTNAVVLALAYCSMWLVTCRVTIPIWSSSRCLPKKRSTTSGA